MWNSECGMRKVEFGSGKAERLEFGMRKWECREMNAEFGMRNSEKVAIRKNECEMEMKHVIRRR
jgi:hypothetical protein